MIGKLRSLFSKKETQNTSSSDEEPIDENQSIELRGRQVQKTVFPEVGMSVLEIAMKHKVDWSSNCKRGICARCRCQVNEGESYLSMPNDAEKNRLEPEEIEDGYRLGCQTKIEKVGKISVSHRPYF